MDRKEFEQKRIRSKQSYGLACCKFIDGILHIMMVKKKYTYSFFEFVFCKYPKFDRSKLEKLFDGMTFQEKTDILEMNFDKLWCKIVLNIPDDPKSLSRRIKLRRSIGKKKLDFLTQTEDLNEDDLKEDESLKEKERQTYLIKKQRFMDLTDDGGRKLRELIHHSKSADPIWEIPKGRPEPNEKPIDAAIREFAEETAGNIDNYRILYDIDPIKINYTNAECLYINEYFIAIANDNWVHASQYNCYENNREVEEIRWISIDEVKFLNRGQHTYKRMINLASVIAKLIRPHKPITQRYSFLFQKKIIQQ